jgi:hypothetical protein
MQTDTQLGSVNVIDNRAQLQQQQQPAAKVEKEKPKEKTAEQKEAWQKARDKAHSRMFPNAKPEEKAPAKEKAEKAEGETKEKVEAKPKAEKQESTDGGDGKQGKKEEATATEVDAKPKLPPSAKKEEAPPAVDIEKLARSIAKETATATAQAIKESTAAKEVKVEDDVPEARRRDLEAIKHLEANNPRYKGKVEAYTKFAKAEADYVAKWERENPGQKFDAESEDHTDWYDRHEPAIDPDDITEAKVELKAKALVEREIGGTRKELDDIKLQRDVERAERELPVFHNRNLGLVAGAMGEEVAKAMSELKANESLEGKDPAAHNTLMAVLPELTAQTEAATRIFGTEGRAYNSADKNHAAVAKAALEFETLLLSQPEEKLKDAKGRMFVKLDEWAGMTPAQKANHWTINADLMTAFLANKAAEKAEANYKIEREKLESIAKAYGYTKNGAAEARQTTTTKEVEETEREPIKTRSPSTASRTIIQPGVKVEPKTSKDGGDRMLDRMFRR